MPWLPKLALVPGTYDFVIATETGSPIEAVYAVVRSGDPTVPMALDLNFFVLTEYSALADPAAQAAAEAIIRGEIDRIINGYNLRLGNVRWAVGTPDQIADFSTVDDSANSGQEVRNGCLAAKVVFGVDHRAVNIIIVDSIVSVEEGIGPGETLGVAVGVPGSFMTPGSGYDCVYTSLDGNYDFTANEFSQTTVHEFGHMLGLQHTTEQDGLFFDRFDDTPECDADTYDSDGDGELLTEECMAADGGNLMFWEGIQLALSPDQIFVISRHPAFYPVQ
jgi:hypothetical protein